MSQRHNKKNITLFLLGNMMLFYSSVADAADKIYSPYVTQGELEVEYFGSRTVDRGAEKNNEQSQQFSLGYAVTDYWKSELYGKFDKAYQDNLTFSQWEWENIFQLTEHGQYWVDLGASLAYEWTPQSNHSDTLEARLLLAKDIEKTSHILNVITEKDVGSGPKKSLEGKLLWSSRYTFSQYFEPGFEIESDLGELNKLGSFDSQEHYVGPAIYGKLPLQLTTRADALKYRMGYLFGVSNAAKDGQAIIQLEYELRF